jgi:hypothetical protein
MLQVVSTVSSNNSDVINKYFHVSELTRQIFRIACPIPIPRVVYSSSLVYLSTAMSFCARSSVN